MPKAKVVGKFENNKIQLEIGAPFILDAGCTLGNQERVGLLLITLELVWLLSRQRGAARAAQAVLEEKVKARTQELSQANANLEHAREMAEAANSAKNLFQSLVWMGNRDGMVVGFDRQRGSACNTCLPDRNSACDAVCPMRLNPRNIKRHMFTCTQCGQCLSACATAQQVNPEGALLRWVSDEDARKNEAGFRPGKGEKA